MAREQVRVLRAELSRFDICFSLAQALVPASRYAQLKSFLKEQPENEFDEYYDKPTTRVA